MKVLLDECVPCRLRNGLVGHDVMTVPERGWRMVRNGDLLARASLEFDALITVDGHLPDQQNLSAFPLAVVILEAKTNRLEDLQPLLPGLLAALDAAHPATVQHVGSPAARGDGEP